MVAYENNLFRPSIFLSTKELDLIRFKHKTFRFSRQRNLTFQRIKQIYR